MISYMSNRTLAISAAVLVAALAFIVPKEVSWLMNLWKGQ